MLLLGALLVAGVRYVLEKRAQRRREAAYQSALSSYTAVLRPGMTRKEVEDYFRAKNIRFRQMCCVDIKTFSRNVFDDLTKIGQEEAPWFCSERNIYVAFQLDGPARNVGWNANDSDRLKVVTIYPWLEGCL